MKHITAHISPEDSPDPGPEVVINLSCVVTASPLGDEVTAISLSDGQHVYLAMPYSEFRDRLMWELYEVESP